MHRVWFTLILLSIATSVFAKQEILVQAPSVTNQGQVQQMRLDIEQQLSIKMRLIKQKEKMGSYIFEIDGSVSEQALERLAQQMNIRLLLVKKGIMQPNQTVIKARAARNSK